MNVSHENGAQPTVFFLYEPSITETTRAQEEMTDHKDSNSIIEIAEKRHDSYCSEWLQNTDQKQRVIVQIKSGIGGVVRRINLL